MPPNVNSVHPTTVAIAYESTQGQPPGFALPASPGGTAAGWAAAEGTTADRIHVIEADPAFIRAGAIEDPRLRERIFQKFVPIKGLRNVDGGTITVGLTGSESTTADATQVAETGLMRLLEHCLGGLTRGYTTAVAPAPTSDTSYSVDAATGMDEGLLVAVEDGDDTGRLFPQRILTLSGVALTTDQDLPFAIAENDVVHAVATCFIDPDALANPADVNASTVSVLIEKAGEAWEAVGCRLQLDSIEFPRNDVPRFTVSVFGASAFPPGDGSPGKPTWTGTITGAAGLAIGADTKLHLQDKGTVTTNCLDVVSVTVTPGVPVVPIDSVTECEDNMQGRVGYTTQPSDTIIEVQAFVDTAHQDDWDTTQAKVLKYYQVGPAGSCWAVVAPECYLMEPPEYSEANESGMMTLRFVCHEDTSLDATASDLNSARSKLQIGLY